MSDLLASPSLHLRRRSTMEALALDAAQELGAGGEARVLAIPDDDSLVAKLYHEPTLAKARKVALMMADEPALDASAAALAWPRDLLIDGQGRFAGFLMERAAGPRVFELYNPSTRRSAAPGSDHALLHRVGANVAAAFGALHERGYVIGDVNESNVLVRPGGAVTLVDTDSMQVPDRANGTVLRSRVGKPEFTPPELQGRSFGDFDRTPEHDRFGLAVLLFLLLMEGTHPFAGRLVDGSDTPPVEERIRRGLFPHHGHAEIDPPRLAPEFALLDPALRALFVRAFAEGHADPAARPSAAEWRTALDAAADALVVCAKSARHRHGPHLGECPWCERTAVLQGRDPFPADAQPTPPRPKPARAPAPRALPVPARKPPLPAAKPVLTAMQPRPSTAVATATRAPLPGNAHPPGALAPGGEEWLEQALGKRGALHPGAWVAPALVMMFGPPEMVVLGMIGFPIALIMALMRLGEPHSEPRLPATFAVPAALLLLLVLWISSTLGGMGMGADSTGGPGGGIPDYAEAPYSAPGQAPDGWRVNVAEPTSDIPARQVILLNRGTMEREASDWFTSTAADVPHQLRLVVYVSTDGGVDPVRIWAEDSSDPGLASAVAAAARGMRFSFLNTDGEPAEGYVRMDVTYGP